jgi:hypothetical protein
LPERDFTNQLKSGRSSTDIVAAALRASQAPQGLREAA